MMYLDREVAQAELHTLARGKRAHLPIRVLAQYVLTYLIRDSGFTHEPSSRDDSLQFLERLYALKDPRSLTDKFAKPPNGYVAVNKEKEI